MTTKYFIEPPADMSTLPDPPVPADLDLRHFDCMHLNVDKLLKAEIWDECSDAEVATALRFWAHAWKEVPCSSLPNDDQKLMKMAGCKGQVRRWKSIRSGSARGFRLCKDGRLYHSTVADSATRAATKSRAGKRGALVRWSDDKSLKSHKTSDATASNTGSRTDGTSDDTLYSSGDGRPHGKGHGITDGKTMQRREGNTLTPLPPLSSAAGSGSLEAHPARPAVRPKPQADPEIDVGGGVILAINSAGICDLVTAPRDAVIPDFTQEAAKALRAQALASRERPPDQRTTAAADHDHQGAA